MKTITVHVKTKSKKEGVEFKDGIYIVRVNTPPVEGKANQEVQKLLSKYLGVPKTSLVLQRGLKSKEKVFCILD